MKMKLYKIASTVLVIAMLFGNEVLAASRRDTFTVAHGQRWNYRPNLSRGGNYNNILARTYAVYPTGGGADNYKRVQVKGCMGTVGITDTYVLNEEDDNNKPMPIYNGYMNQSSICFAFRGNAYDHEARTDCYYDAR